MRKKTALVVIGLVGLFVGVALVAAWLTDVITEDYEVVMEDPGPGFPVSDRLAGADDGSTDVGSHAVLVPATVALPPPLLPGEPAWMATGSAGGPPAPTPTIADQPTSGGPGATPTTAPTTTADATTSTATTTPSTAGPAVADASPAIGTLWRFLDLCADQPVPQCPAGIGATVLFGGGSAPPPPLAFDIFPDPPQAIRDQVRCDLAWPSGTVLPVLLTSNQPLDVADARLRIRNGAAIDSVLDQRTMPTEVGWYEQRVLAGALVGTSVGDGVHTCLAFRLDGPAAPTGIDRNGYFEVEVTAYVGSRSHTVTRRFDGHYLAGKPSVRVIPVDGYRATVIVPQRQNDNVTVTLFTTSQDHGSPGRGACPTNSQQKLIGFLTPRNPGVGPPAYPPAQLADPGYPFDRDYTHYRVWDLYLKSGQDYVLCISWELDGVREHWVMQTPASYRVYVGGTTLGYNRTVAEGSLLLRIPGIEDCWVANPGQFSADGRDPFPEILLQHHSGWETWRLPDPTLCNSNGWRLPETIEIEARLTAPGDTTLYGITRIPLQELLGTCVFRSPSGDPAPVECDGPPVEWRLQKVLCGGPISTGSCGGPDITLGIRLAVRPDIQNLTTDPRDWSVSQVAIADFGTAGALTAAPTPRCADVTATWSPTVRTAHGNDETPGTRPGVFGVELLGHYQNQTDVRDQLVHLLSLPSWTGRVDEPDPRQRQRRLREDAQLELITRYRTGESVYCLAKAFDITRQTVSKILERHDVPRRYRLLADADIAEASQLYEQGLSLADIGERFGISARTVLHAFRKVGFATRPVGTSQWG